MEPGSEIIEKALIAALELAGERGWRTLTLRDIAEAADMDLSDFHGVASKDTLVDAASGYFDKAMLDGDVDTDDRARERLFDVIMLRFEAMEPYREGLTSLMTYRERSPARIGALLGARQASAHWALIAAGLDDDEGAPISLKEIAIAWAIRKAENAWRKETSADFSRTMSVLDRELRSADERMGWLSRLRGTRREKSEGAEAETPDDEAKDE